MASCDLNLKATELCLGLPGAVGKVEKMLENTAPNLHPKVTGKRGFSETVDLKLNLHSNNLVDGGAIADDHHKPNNNINTAQTNSSTDAPIKDPAKPPAKAQVVGWPPVRSYRKNVMAVVQKSNRAGDEDNNGKSSTVGAFVKVCMDGAPYLRKMDLNLYSSYHQLSLSLANMLSSFTTGNIGEQGMIDFMNQRKLMDLLKRSEYVPTYEDKDGDWMLVGDVPWEMFVNSCKRLRIIKGSEAIGLAPRAMEKCKSRA